MTVKVADLSANQRAGVGVSLVGRHAVKIPPELQTE